MAAAYAERRDRHRSQLGTLGARPASTVSHIMDSTSHITRFAFVDRRSDGLRLVDMISAATHAHLVVRRHVDLGRTRSMMCRSPLTSSSRPAAAASPRPAVARGLSERQDHCRTCPDLRFQSPRRPRHTEIPRPKRGEGQWALGYTEPLNKNEQSKKDDDPLNVRARILNIYSKRGFASIDPADLRGRFRWMGLYTQRAPGFDGGKTAMLEEEELDDEFFMMRVRSDGRLLPAAHGARARRDRPGLRARHRRRHRPREHPVPLDPDRGRARRSGQKLDAAGLDSTEACGDSPRPFLGSPVAGVAPGRDHRRLRGAGGDQAPRDRQPGVLQPPAQVQDRAHRPPEPRRRPPRPTTSRSSARCTPSTAPASTSGSAAGSRPTRCSPRSSASGCPLDEVPDVWEGVTSIFRDYGYRRLRSRARLKFLVADWGVEKFREVLEKEYLGRELVELRPAARPPPATATTSACTSRRTATSTSASRRSPAGSPAPTLVAAGRRRWSSTASRAPASRRTRRSC